MSDRDKASELVELICKALGVSLSGHDPATQQGAISEAEYWLRNNRDDDDWDY